MRSIESVALVGQATFGRDGAMFENVLGFVGQLSVVLWSLVILTVIIRFVGIRIYQRGGAARAALVDTAALSASAPSAGQLSDIDPGLFGSTAAEKDVVLVPAEFVDGAATDVVTFDEVLLSGEVPAAVAASVKVPHGAPRNRRAESGAPSREPAFAVNSMEA